jgi:S1-C subfamily serine protease
MPISSSFYKRHAATFLLFITVAQAFLAAQTRGQKPPVLSTREIAARVRESLVLIVTQDREGNPVAQGSGVLIAPNWVATNLHVLKRASQVYVKSLSDGVSYKADSVFGFDLKHDLCGLLLLDDAGVALPESRDAVAPGDEILVAGNPEGLEASFSKGIVSGIRSGSGLIQIDAAISPGSSGGPVVNERGELVGLAVSSLVEGQNLNFAVPVRYLDQLNHRSVDIRWAGALAVTDSEGDGFRGPVRSYGESHASYTFNRAKAAYVEGPAVMYAASTFNRDGRAEETTFFKKGLENGKLLWEYGDNGLVKRHVDVDGQGQRTAHDYSEKDSITVLVMRTNFDETTWSGSKGEANYQEYTYDSGGNLRQQTFADGTKWVMKYDSFGRKTDLSEYKNGKLDSVTHFTYDVNEHGDWTRCHETIWLADYPDSGFTPWEEDYREITYWGQDLGQP